MYPEQVCKEVFRHPCLIQLDTVDLISFLVCFLSNLQAHYISRKKENEGNVGTLFKFVSFNISKHQRGISSGNGIVAKAGGDKNGIVGIILSCMLESGCE